MKRMNRLAGTFLLASVLFLAAGAPTYSCGGGTEEDETDEAEVSPAERCRQACSALYGCGLFLPDGVSGVPLSLTQCRSGCGDDPGNIACVEQCVEDFEVNEFCEDLEGCVADVCAVPIGSA
ncbi:MAG: hypothetical protein M5R36_19515 [Deltaproteobacteria bacterium]|nr:hypothetical protein [Deltaproteobacteria bacterium]